MTRPLLIATLALSTALAGCNMAPKYLRPVGAVPATLPQGGVYKPAATDAPDVSKIGWRAFFTDPRLQQVIAQALDNNRDLRIAAGNVLQARAQYRVTRADRLPTVNTTLGATYTNNLLGAAGGAAGGTTTGTGAGTGVGTGIGSGTGTGIGTGTGGTTGGAAATSSSAIEIYQANVGVSAFELDLFGRVKNLSEAALQQYFASEEAQRTTRITLIAETATAWATLASDQDLLRIARDTLKTFEQSLELTRAQFRIGVASELEARQAETQYHNARNDIATLQARIAQDQNALNLLVGTTVTAELLPTGLGTGEVTIPTLPADLSSQVLLRRPDVIRAEHLLIAENANIGAARAAMFPTISLTATLGTLSTALTGLFGANTETWTVSPQASLPIFDFGRRKNNLRYAEASQQVAISTYEKTLQTAFREVADALATRGTIDEQLSARTGQTEAANVTARLADARYRAGVDSFLTSLDSQRTAYAARQSLVTTRLARVSNLVELYRSLGGGLN